MKKTKLNPTSYFLPVLKVGVTASLRVAEKEVGSKAYVFTFSSYLQYRFIKAYLFTQKHYSNIGHSIIHYQRGEGIVLSGFKPLKVVFQKVRSFKCQYVKMKNVCLI